MDRDTAVGFLGTFASFTLETVHLVAACVCAVLTAVHLSVSIYVKIKGRDRGRDK